jgi:hypothetical protein
MLTGLASLALAGPAAATVLADFTDRAWSAAEGTNSYTLGGVTLQAFYTGFGTPTLTFNAGAAAGCANAAAGLACAGDGIGIDSRLLLEDPGEIDTGAINLERLRVSFSAPRLVTGFDVLNFFRGGTGEYRLDGGSWLSFTSTSTGGDGGFTPVAVAGGPVSVIDFRSANVLTDFSLARIRTAVPEPAAFALLAVGLAAAGFGRRRAVR